MTRIGFIGVGTMGLPMAKNLVKKGFTVTAFDSNPEAVKAAATAGMTAAASAAEAVATADIVVTMLPSSPHVESVYTGDGGVLAAARKGTLCVDMSTIDPAISQRVARAAQERGVRFMDAPVSGGTPRATEGTLAIMVGGAAADFEEAKPALSAMGANVIHVGPVGSGEVVKLCNNLIAGVCGVAVSEAFRIAEGIPVYGIEIAERDLPQETSQIRGLHFSKGCYLGQEIVERIRSRGNVHKHLRQLELDGLLPSAGAELELDGVKAGQIRSAAEVFLGSGSRKFAFGMINSEAEVHAQPLTYRVGAETGKAGIVSAPPTL